MLGVFSHQNAVGVNRQIPGGWIENGDNMDIGVAIQVAVARDILILIIHIGVVGVRNTDERITVARMERDVNIVITGAAAIRVSEVKQPPGILVG